MNVESIRATRATLGMTQKQLAAALGVTRQSVYMWEAGKTPAPRVVYLALEALEQRQFVARMEALGWARMRDDREADSAGGGTIAGVGQTP